MNGRFTVDLGTAAHTAAIPDLTHPTPKGSTVKKKTLVTLALSAAAATALPSLAWALTASEAVEVSSSHVGMAIDPEVVAAVVTALQPRPGSVVEVDRGEIA